MKTKPNDIYIRFDDWHLLRDHYVVFGDLEDIDALADNFEYFGVTPLWLNTIDAGQFELEGYEPLGLMFIRVPKWRREEVAKAFNNYAKRMEWKHHGYMTLAQDVIAELLEAASS